MEYITFKPFAEGDAVVKGLLHSPILEMNPRRESFPAVVICPGGAYCFLSNREGDPVAQAFFAAGYNVFILYYSVGEKAKDYRPLQEISKTVMTIRENAAQWHTTPSSIAVCGFSAGGHLAGSLGTMWDDPGLKEKMDTKKGANRPDAMILCYPVISAGPFAHVTSMEQVSGCKKGTPGYTAFSLEEKVSEKTCPAFLWHTVTDDCVPVENTLLMASALQKAGVSFELHLFPRGGHGMSVCTEETGSLDTYNGKWLPLCIDWLNHQFYFIP